MVLFKGTHLERVTEVRERGKESMASVAECYSNSNTVTLIQFNSITIMMFAYKQVSYSFVESLSESRSLGTYRLEIA